MSQPYNSPNGRRRSVADSDRRAERRAELRAELRADCRLACVVPRSSAKCLQTTEETVEYEQHLRINLTLRLGASRNT